MKKAFAFLRDLKKNNNRDWFNANKDRYLEAKEAFEQLVQHVQSMLMERDQLDPGGTKYYRIYRDVRFSKDKTPYKTQMSAHFTRATEARRGGYYLQLQPGGSFVGGGFWAPNADDLLLIRKHLEQDAKPLRKIIEGKDFKTYFGELQGDAVKTAPKGFRKDHPDIDLIRYKQFLLSHPFTDEEILSPEAARKITDGFKRMRPFFDYMSDILTHDLNGASLLK